MLAGKWGAVGGRVLMNSVSDMLTLRGLWEMSAGSLNTNLDFWGRTEGCVQFMGLFRTVTEVMCVAKEQMATAIECVPSAKSYALRVSYCQQ